MPFLSSSIWLAPCSVCRRGAEGQHFPQFGVRQFGEPPLRGGAHHLVGGLLLGLNHGVDAVFEGAGADHLVDVDVPRLTDAEGAVGGLVFDGRVPLPVVVDDMVGARQVQAGTAGLQRQDEDLGAMRVVLEAFHHPVAVLARHAAVEHGRLDAVGFLDVLAG